MTTPIGSASITVQAVTDAFRNDLTADTDRVLESLERNFDRTWDNLRQTVDSNTDLMVVTFNQAATDIQETMRDTASSMERSFDRAADRSADRLESAFQSAARDIVASFEQASEQSADRVEAALTEIRLEMQRTTESIEADADEAGDAIGGDISRGVLVANAALALLRDAGDRALSSVGGLGGALTGVAGRGVSAFTSLGAAATKASLGIAAFAQAAAAAVAAIEQLAGVALIAPAAILSFVTVTKTLGVALNGVSDAISASLSDDIGKFTKAMDKLEPSAQAAIVGLTGVLSSFQNIGNVIQQNFFENLSDPLREFGEEAERVARDNLIPLSTVLGNVARGFLEAATQSNLFTGVSAVLAQTVSGVSSLEGPIARLAPAFGSLFLVGSEYVDDMYAAVGRLLDRFTTFVGVAAEDGSLQLWITEALEGFRQIGRILGNLGSAFGSLTSNASQAGTGLLAILEQTSQALDEALSSDRGQAFLIASFGLLAQVIESVSIVAGPLVELFAVFATSLATRLTSALQAVEPFLRTVAELLSGLGDRLPGLNEGVNGLAQNGFTFLAEKAGLLLEALSPVVPLFEEFVSNLSSVGAGFDGAFLDSLVAGLGELAVGLSAGLFDVLDSLVVAFAALGQELPRVSVILGEVADVVGSVLGTAIDAVTPLVSAFVDALAALTPAVAPVGNALSGIAQITGGLLLALSPLLTALSQMTSILAQALNPAVTALRLTFAAIQPQLQSIVQIFGTAFVNAFVALKPGLDAFVDGFVKLLPLFAQFIPPLKEIALAVAPLIELIGQLAGEALERLVPILFRMIEAAIQFDLVIMNAMIPVITELVRLIVENLGPAFMEVLRITSGAMDGIADAVVTAYAVIGPILAVFINVLSVVLPAAFESAKTFIKIAWDAIVLVVETAWDIISGVFLVITRFLSGDFAGAWKALENMVVDVFEGIWEFIVNTVNNIIGFFNSDAIGRLASAVGGMFEAAYNAVVGWMASVWDSVTSTFESVITWFKELPGRIFEALGNAKDWLFQFGKDIINGLIEGLKDAAGMIKDVVTNNVINPIKGFFSDAFDFGSPSKVTKQWGSWIGEGFAIGMENAESGVVAAAEALTMAAALPGIALTGASALNPSGTAAFTPVTSGGFTVPAAGGALFGPGSIQVVFSGVTPSESQAYATGQAVGAGIADEIARRDARMAVGVL